MGYTNVIYRFFIQGPQKINSHDKKFNISKINFYYKPKFYSLNTWHIIACLQKNWIKKIKIQILGQFKKKNAKKRSGGIGPFLIHDIWCIYDKVTHAFGSICFFFLILSGPKAIETLFFGSQSLKNH